jgi:phosphatidylserine/phosphatidylglycerophosphate/cardiolipin synthase-like enzyme
MKIFKMRHLVLCLLLIFPISLPAAESEIVTAFSPGNAQELVLRTIGNAEKSIHVAAYSFTSKPVATALVAAQKRGVEVRVVADQKSNATRYTAVTFLANQGVPVRLNSKYAIMHNKFMVVDGRTVQTGSYNYTKGAAERNAENVIVIIDDVTIAGGYEAEWGRLWDEGADMGK